MLTIDIPGRPSLSLAYVVLDVNGTITVDGAISDEVAERIRELGRNLKVWLLTADTFGTAKELARRLGVEAIVLEPGGREQEQKAEFVRGLGPGGCVAIGNGANDTSMLEAADLGIAVLGREGLCPELLTRADLVVTSPEDALDLLLFPRRLVATLRK
ncbi:MAG: HAD family hydrolase [Deltaproteobacteria bacterium]|nr:HAD family hydrolase [Deltaproteobacteria bacterium]